MSPRQRVKFNIDTLFEWLDTTKGKLTKLVGLIVSIIVGIGYIGDYAIYKNELKKNHIDQQKKIDFIYNSVQHWPQILSDLDDVKKEQAIAHTELTKLVLRKFDCAYFRADKQGLTYEINPQTSILLGRPFEDLKGIGWTNFIVQNDKQRVLNNMKNSVEKGIDFYDNFTIFRPDSTKKRVNAVAFGTVYQNILIAYSGFLQ